VTPSPSPAAGGGDVVDTDTGDSDEGGSGERRDSSDGTWHRGGRRGPRGGGKRSRAWSIGSGAEPMTST
jgi:hypothetical protein